MKTICYTDRKILIIQAIIDNNNNNKTIFYQSYAKKLILNILTISLKY